MILRKALRERPGLGHNLILEINETSAMQVPDVLRPFMDEMRSHGIVFALDDFGAGMISLRLLHELRFEIAKIDGELVRNVDSSADGQVVTRAAIALAQEMGMYVSAEAVETQGEANWLRAAGVGCLQGYLFGPPTVTPDFRAFRHGRPDPDRHGRCGLNARPIRAFAGSLRRQINRIHLIAPTFLRFP
jgi:EAL domain-containing protein (putative c-di-GMP-specific phosphodiesterase class I)